MSRVDFPIDGPRGYLDKQYASTNIPLILRDIGMSDALLRSVKKEHIHDVLMSLAKEEKRCLLVGRDRILALGPSKYHLPGIDGQEPNFYAGCFAPLGGQTYDDLLWSTFNEMVKDEPEFITIVDLEGEKVYQVSTGFSQMDMAGAAKVGKQAASIDANVEIADLMSKHEMDKIYARKKSIRLALATFFAGAVIGGTAGYILAEPDKPAPSIIDIHDGEN